MEILTTKICSTCKTPKPTTEFHKSSKERDGLQRKCKPCNIANVIKNQKQDNNKRLHKTHKKQRQNRVQALNNIKSRYGCCICGEKEGFCLDFHHIDNKNECVSRLLHRRQFESMILEINKCVVICSNCHRKYHNNIIEIDNPTLCNVTIEDWYCEFEEVKQNFDTFDKEKFLNILKQHSITDTARIYKVTVATINRWINKYKIEKPHYFENNRCEFYKNSQKHSKKPTKEILEKLIWKYPKTKIGCQFGVSDNAVEKWIKYYNLEKPPRGFFIRKQS